MKNDQPTAGANDHAAISEKRIVLLMGGLFFVIGFVTWLNSPLITFVKLAFKLDDVSAFMVPMAFYMSYFFFSLPSAAILNVIGMKKGMALGLLVMAAGSAVFGQLATMRIFPGTLIGLFIIGAGLTILQAASNPYISLMGSFDRAAQRIAVLGICNKLAGALAPVVFGLFVMSGISQLDASVTAAADSDAREAIIIHFAQGIYAPYMAMAAVLAVLSVMILMTALPELSTRSEAADSQTQQTPSLFKATNLWLGFWAIFFYVGVEVIAGDAIGTYARGFDLPLDETKFLGSATLIAMLIGYGTGYLIVPRFIAQEQYLAQSAALGIVLTTMAYLSTGYLSVLFVASLGFANAMMWPAIFPTGISGLGRHTPVGAAILIMGVSGGAVIPQTFANLKNTHDFQAVFLILTLICYAYILIFGLFAIQRATAREKGY